MASGKQTQKIISKPDNFTSSIGCIMGCICCYYGLGLPIYIPACVSSGILIGVFYERHFNC